MKIRYIIKETFRGFGTAKFSTFASVLTIAISLSLITIFTILYLTSNKLIKSIKEKVEIEVFLNDNITTEEVNSLIDKIRTIGGIKQVTFVSKEEAKRIFEKDWGKEMLEVLDYNPLPPSLKINLYEEYKTIDRMSKIKSQLSALNKVEEVKFPEGNLHLIEENSSAIMYVLLVILVTTLFGSIFLVANTIRLVINSRRKVIQIHKLLGATNSFIIMPYFLQGLLQGLFGSIISLGVLYGVFTYYSSKFQGANIKIEFFDIYIVLYICFAGIVLGSFGSLLSAKKFLKLKLN
ncbi:MAG: cell division protein FtsX [Ignavibacteria bacterium]